MADKNPNFDNFKKALLENGAEFSDSFMTNLLRIIQHMKPVGSQNETNKTNIHTSNPLAQKFPGLAIPNEKPIFSSDNESDTDKKAFKRITTSDIFKDESKSIVSKDEVVDQAMAELEALAPSNNKSSEVKSTPSTDQKVVKVTRPKSRDRRSRRSRDRSRDRRSRSRDKNFRIRDKRSRSRERARDKDKSRDRRRRSRSRHRDRSRDRRSRSRSRGKRSQSRERDFKRDRDCGRKLRKKSSEVEISDDPESGKVSFC